VGFDGCADGDIEAEPEADGDIAADAEPEFDQNEFVLYAELDAELEAELDAELEAELDAELEAELDNVSVYLRERTGLRVILEDTSGLRVILEDIDGARVGPGEYVLSAMFNNERSRMPYFSIFLITLYIYVSKPLRISIP
jgi:hypothetical protein